MDVNLRKWRIRSTIRRPKFQSRRTARMKDGRLIRSRMVLRSWTHLQHLEQNTANRYDAENLILWAQPVDSLSDSIEEKHVTEDDWQPLEKHSGWTGIVQVLHHQHVSVKVLSHLRQPELKPGKEWGVVQCPLGCVLQKTAMLFKYRGKVKRDRSWDLFDWLFDFFFLTLTVMWHHAYLLQKYLYLIIWYEFLT